MATDPNRVASDLKRLTAVFSGLSRQKDAILTYLEEVYRTAASWRSLNRKMVLQHVSEIIGRKLDRRVTRTANRLLVELTCKSDIKLKSRYANALEFARMKECDASQVMRFIREREGIEKCSRAYVNRKRRK